MSTEETRDTKERILDAAEALFADQGFSASMRNVTTEAGANLAAVNYHFGSKEALIEAVFSRRLGPLNRQRLKELDAAEAASESGLATLEDIVEAFVGPALRIPSDPAFGGEVFMRLLGHTMSRPHGKIREMFTEQFREVFTRFSGALRGALPALPPDELVWRFLFMVGSMAHTMAMSDDIHRMSGGVCDSADVEGTIRRLVPFLCAGLRSPGPQTAPPEA
jgi:AcrR family transcriptional regulator